MSKLDLLADEEMTDKEKDQYAAYCEEQERLSVLYAKQQKEKAISMAKKFLEENGYLVTKK